jgi:hypothetical protein
MALSRQAFGLLVRPLAVTGVMLILFTAARLALRGIYAGDFTLVPAAEYPSILLRGLRFDLSIILSATAGFLVLMIIFPERSGRLRFGWRSLWPWLTYAIFVFFLLAIAVDLVYFGHVHRHLGPKSASPPTTSWTRWNSPWAGMDGCSSAICWRPPSCSLYGAVCCGPPRRPRPDFPLPPRPPRWRQFCYMVESVADTPGTGFSLPMPIRGFHRRPPFWC